MLLTEEQAIKFPVQHFSQSGIKTYLEDRQNFFKNNIRYEFDNFTKPAFIVGKVVHKVLEDYYESIKDSKKFNWNISLDLALDDEFRQLKDDEVIENNYAKLAEIKSYFNLPGKVDIRSEDTQGKIQEKIDEHAERLNNPRIDLGEELWPSEWTEPEDSCDNITKHFIKLKQEIIENDSKIEIKWDKKIICRKDVKDKSEEIIGFYSQELPKDIYKVISTEETMFSDFEDLNGDTMPIPLKGIIDLIWENEDGDIIIEDHKTTARVKKIKNGDVIDPGFEIQAVVNWFLVRAKYGINPKKMIFRQIIKSKTPCPLKKSELVELCQSVDLETKGLLIKDLKELAIKHKLWIPDPQVVPYEITFDSDMINRFIEIYTRIIKELSGQSLVSEDGQIKLLPNPFKMFGGTESWVDFCEEVKNGGYTLDEIIDERSEKYEDLNGIDFNDF